MCTAHVTTKCKLSNPGLSVYQMIRYLTFVWKLAEGEIETWETNWIINQQSIYWFQTKTVQQFIGTKINILYK